MAYFFGIALLGLLFIVLHFFTEISLKQKLSTTAIIAFLILGAFLFNQASETRRLHLETILLDFTHGNTIFCSEIDVNQSLFSYSSGTQTFIGLKDTPMLGRLISLDKCQ